MELLDRFAATLAEAEPDTLSCLREYCQWMANQRGAGLSGRPNVA
jgi:hypothetical protein